MNNNYMSKKQQQQQASNRLSQTQSFGKTIKKKKINEKLGTDLTQTTKIQNANNTSTSQKQNTQNFNNTQKQQLQNNSNININSNINNNNIPRKKKSTVINNNSQISIQPQRKGSKNIPKIQQIIKIPECNKNVIQEEDLPIEESLRSLSKKSSYPPTITIKRVIRQQREFFKIERNKHDILKSLQHQKQQINNNINDDNNNTNISQNSMYNHNTMNRIQIDNLFSNVNKLNNSNDNSLQQNQINNNGKSMNQNFLQNLEEQLNEQFLNKECNIRIIKKGDKHIYDWKIDDVMLGQGSIGEVYKAQDQISKKDYALKFVRFNRQTDLVFMVLMNEVALLKQIQGESEFIQFQDAYVQTDETKEENSAVLVMQLCSCNLQEIIQFRHESKMKWEDDQLLFIFQYLLNALSKLKNLGITHRDIKPHNILYCYQDSSYKIGDFSEGKILANDIDKSQDLQTYNLNEIHSVRGTGSYLSPELKLAYKQNCYTAQVNPYLSDLYSLGITFLQMIYTDPDPTSFLIQAIKRPFSQQKGTFLPLIQRLLSEKPQDRLKYKEELEILKQKLNFNQINTENNIKIMNSSDLEIVEIISSLKSKKSDVQWKIKKLELISQGYEKIFQIQESMKIQYQILEICEKHKLLSQLSMTTYSLGRLHYDQGQLDMAESLLQKSFSVRVEQYGPQDEKVAEILSVLGSVYKELKDFDKALQFYEQALNIIIQNHGSEDILVSDLNNNLAVVYLNLGKTQEAINYFQKAIDITVKVKGENCKNISCKYSNLGALYMDQNEFEQAKYYLFKALELDQINYGENDPQVGDCMANIGVLFIKQNMFNHAQPHFEKQKNILVKFYDENHWKVGQVYNYLGVVMQGTNQFEMALTYFQKSLEILEKVQSQLSIINDTLSNLGCIYMQLEDYQQALQYFEKARERIEKENNNLQNEDYAEIICSQARCYQYMNQNQTAIDHFLDALELFEQIDTNHPRVNIIQKRVQELQEKSRE